MPESPQANLKIRQGNEADLAKVAEICRDVNGGNDYIPQVWEEWTALSENRGFIVEKDGQPAGVFFLRLDVAGYKTGWLQGVRVAAPFRNQRVARYILQQAIRHCQDWDLDLIRYVTAQDNAPMHRLAELNGFRHIGNFLNYNFARQEIMPRGNTLASRLVTTSEFDEAYRLTLGSPEYQLGNGIYCNNWNWKPLSIDTFRQHLERREVYCLTGALKGLAIMHRADSASFWISFLAGDAAAKSALLQELTRRVTNNILPDQPLEFCAQLFQTPANESLLGQAGFVPDNHEPVMSLYELNLQNLPTRPIKANN